MPPSSRLGTLLGVRKRSAGQGEFQGLTHMRHIHLDDGLRLRFPGRSEEFDQGVEIGMVAVLMDQGTTEFTRWVSRANFNQIEAIAKQMGYHLVEEGGDHEWVNLTFRFGVAKRQPKLRLVHSV